MACEAYLWPLMMRRAMMMSERYRLLVLRKLLLSVGGRAFVATNVTSPFPLPRNENELLICPADVYGSPIQNDVLDALKYVPFTKQSVGTHSKCAFSYTRINYNDTVL